MTLQQSLCEVSKEASVQNDSNMDVTVITKDGYPCQKMGEVLIQRDSNEDFMFEDITYPVMN